jgi:glutamate formiminotransferase/formiminotetrahydrofolate cyclodeaminase
MRIVECVPNISEGRDQAVIEAVSGVIHQVEGCELLDVDPGAATNRTVITFVGSPDAVVEGAFQLISKARELIDMTQHSGEHPRFGATDVCPFVPVSGVTMEDCVELAKQLAERVGRELDVPVYLYENAATRPERRNLAHVRSGEYEALEAKLKDPENAPDYGPAEFRPRFGALAVSAREFLIAYNVNLNSRDEPELAGQAPAPRDRPAHPGAGSGQAGRELGDRPRREGQAGEAARSLQARQRNRLVHRRVRHRPDLDEPHQLP